MPCEIKEVHKDALTINGFVVEIEGIPFSIFTKVSGPQLEEGEVVKADGGSGKTVKFGDGVKNFGEVTWTANADPSNTQITQLEEMARDSICNGTKRKGSVIKYHHGVEVGKFLFDGMKFKSFQHPDLDKTGSGLYEVPFVISVDFWEVLWGVI